MSKNGNRKESDGECDSCGKYRSFLPAVCRYVDLGIKYALRDLPPYMVDETFEILLARQLRSRCLLLENLYPEAELEAEICIRTMRRVMPSHIASALYVQAEALYLQCQVTHIDPHLLP